MYCHVCFEPINESIIWGNFFTISTRKICHSCEAKLIRLTNQPYLCEKCMKPMQNDEPICGDCLVWGDRLNEDPIYKNISIFMYDNFMKDLMTKFKYRGDYEIIYIFEKEIKMTFQTYFSKKRLSIVPIPLSSERKKERGFNQAEAIAQFFNQPIKSILTRKSSEKQSKKSKVERIFSENPFQLKNIEPLEDVLLVDDLYTTGTTLRQAANLLKQIGAKTIYSFTLIRS